MAHPLPVKTWIVEIRTSNRKTIPNSKISDRCLAKSLAADGSIDWTNHSNCCASRSRSTACSRTSGSKKSSATDGWDIQGPKPLKCKSNMWPWQDMWPWHVTLTWMRLWWQCSDIWVWPLTLTAQMGLCITSQVFEPQCCHSHATGQPIINDQWNQSLLSWPHGNSIHVIWVSLPSSLD